MCPYLEQKIAFVNAGHVCNSARIYVIHILEAGAFFRRYHLHKRRGRFGTSQHETKALFTLVQDSTSRLAHSARMEDDTDGKKMGEEHYYYITV
jgi:hypothetical protein